MHFEKISSNDSSVASHFTFINNAHHCAILRNLGQSTSHIFIECNAFNLFWQIPCSDQYGLYESWLLFRFMQVRKYEQYDCQKWLKLIASYSCNKITTTWIKFPAKIEMAFSQMLAIRSWSNELQYFLDKKPSHINTHTKN